MDEVTSKATYTVKAGNFEGPLELLLSLIEERKFFVNELSLAQVTDDYIKYIQNIQHDNTDKRIADISAFIIVASTLILIKSKSLLPSLELTSEETEKIEDLETRLKLYQIIKNASIDVKSVFGTKIIFTSPERKNTISVFSPDDKITIEVMASCIENVVSNLPKPKDKLPEVEVRKVISIDEMINNLTSRIQATLSTSFRNFTKTYDSGDTAEMKVTIIVSFLAMLELVREGIIDVMQNNQFEDITMQTLPESSNTDIDPSVIVEQ
jgi:segregation and condensation protein A